MSAKQIQEARYRFCCDNCGSVVEGTNRAPPKKWWVGALPLPDAHEYAAFASVYIETEDASLLPAKRYHLCFACSKTLARRIEAKDL